MSGGTIRILHLEDEPADAELVAEILAAEAVTASLHRVQSRTEFLAALSRGGIDIILADYNLPQFDGLSAQALAAEHSPDIPFIFVSGTLGEEVATERLKAGATDYVLKQRLSRLPAAVRRALAEAKDRRERRRAEQALQELNADLERRVHDATLALQDMVAKAENANRAKSEFVSRMSHDLRTPLNAILGFAQLLHSEPLTESQQESVQLILRGGEHLLELINEVLDIARIEAGHLSLSVEPVDVCAIVQESLELIAPLAATRNIAVTADFGEAAGCAVVADRQRLNQLLMNLLSNAVKYNRRNGRIIVDFERCADRLRIKVTDTGPGLAPEKLQLLFTPFERLGAEATGIEGTGLGLAFSRGLAEAMGGSLFVASEVGRGSTFSVDLALTSLTPIPETSDDTAPAAGEDTVARGVVLYIEDNPSNIRLMERIFQRRPALLLQHAATGAEGLRVAAEVNPDLILLDLHLPDMGGIDVLRLLQADPAIAGIPVAVLSADATRDQARRLKVLGAIEYLTKPLDLAKVLRLLDTALRQDRFDARSAPASAIESRA